MRRPAGRVVITGRFKRMLPTAGYAAKSPTSPLEPFTFERRGPGPVDVLIEIL
jgi:hypothetical protein